MYFSRAYKLNVTAIRPVTHKHIHKKKKNYSLLNIFNFRADMKLEDKDQLFFSPSNVIIFHLKVV